MADFKSAFANTMVYEGGYSNNSADSGGMTIFGISRHNNPSWPGWATVDNYIEQNGLATISHDLRNDADFWSAVQSFYTDNYWNVNRCGDINDNQVAGQVFDKGVNMGTGTAARFLQQAANVPVDGVIGNQTIGAVNAANPADIYNAFIGLCKARYEAIVAANPSQERFQAGWFSRLPPYQEA